MNSDDHSAEFAGVASVCTLDDCPVLLDLYRSACPDSSALETVTDIQASEIFSWSIYRDVRGKTHIAAFAYATGTVWILARPDECISPEAVRGFLVLMTEIRKALLKYGATDLTVTYPPSIEPLMTRLQMEGFLSKGVVVARAMRFGESGEIERVV